jgi:hypothetical protein
VHEGNPACVEAYGSTQRGMSDALGARLRLGAAGPTALTEG